MTCDVSHSARLIKRFDRVRYGSRTSLPRSTSHCRSSERWVGQRREDLAHITSRIDFLRGARYVDRSVKQEESERPHRKVVFAVAHQRLQASAETQFLDFLRLPLPHRPGWGIKGTQSKAA